MDAIPGPGPRKAQIWLFDLAAAPPDLDTLASLLDADERARAARFRFESDRTAFIVSHGKLRRLLGSCLGEAADAVRLMQAPGEKPVLGGHTGLHFSLSHSGGIGMVGLATSPIGVDVEVVRDLADRDAIVRRYFAPAEVVALSALPEPARHRAFFACWTRKEAYVKAIGLGLSAGLDRFAVSIGDTARIETIDGRADEAAQWSLWSKRLGDIASLAAATRDPSMSYDVFES